MIYHVIVINTINSIITIAPTAATGTTSASRITSGSVPIVGVIEGDITGDVVDDTSSERKPDFTQWSFQNVQSIQNEIEYALLPCHLST